MNADPRQVLIRSLETLVGLSEKTAAEVREARQRADQARAMFERMMGGDRSVSVADAFQTNVAVGEQNARLRESSFLMAFRALMHLYGEENRRESAEAVFKLLGAAKLLDSEADPQWAPPPAFAPDAGERSELLTDFMSHQKSLDQWMDERNRDLDRRMAEQDAKLKEALEIARSLVKA